MNYCKLTLLSFVLWGVLHAWPGDTAWVRIAAPLDSDRLAHAVAWDPVGDMIYMYGGTPDGRIGSNVTFLDRFDPVLGTWQRLNHMINPRGWFKGIYCRGKLYALGGYDGYHVLAMASCEAYDITRLRWRPIASLPSARCAYGAVVWRDSLIYVLGGLGPMLEAESLVLAYDVCDDTWHYATPLPCALDMFDACLIGNTIWLCVADSLLSGEINPSNPLHIAWRSRPGVERVWRTHLQPCVALRGRIVFWAKWRDTVGPQKQSIYILDPITGCYDTLPRPPIPAGLFDGTIHFCFAVARESASEVYKIAGDDNGDWDPPNCTYYKLKLDFPEAVAEQTSPKTLSPRQPLGATVVRGRLLVNPEPASKQASLHDVTGHRVADLRSGSWDITHLSAGIYFLRLGDSGLERILKVVIAD